MIRIDLCEPVILEKQIFRLEEIGQDGKTDLAMMLAGKKFYRKGSGDEPGTILDDAEKGTLTNVWGVMAYCKERGIEIKPVDKIVLNSSLYGDCTDKHWRDFSMLAYKVDTRNGRLKRLIELNAPEIILTNERRLLYETVELLENGLYHRSAYVVEGRMCRALCDIGYSLVDGYFREEDGYVDVDKRREMDFANRVRRRMIIEKVDADQAFLDELFAKGKRQRVMTIEGVGFYLKHISEELVGQFIINHKETFLQNEDFDNIQELLDKIGTIPLCELFKGSVSESEKFRDGATGVVADIISRETGIRMDGIEDTGVAYWSEESGDFEDDDDDKKDKEKRCEPPVVMFSQDMPWVMTEKEKALTYEELIGILDGYARELGVYVENVYHTVEIDA